MMERMAILCGDEVGAENLPIHAGDPRRALSWKDIERQAIQAALESSIERAQLALLLYPPVGEWKPAKDFLQLRANSIFAQRLAGADKRDLPLA